MVAEKGALQHGSLLGFYILGNITIPGQISKFR
jgi:hypothetical protein